MAYNKELNADFFINAPLQEAADRGIAHEGQRKKHIVRIGDTEYLNKNVQAPRRPKWDTVDIGQHIPWKRAFGESRRNANLLSMNEVLVSRMLQLLAHDADGNKLFHVPLMSLHQSQIGGFSKKSFTILSKITDDFRLMRDDIYDIRSGEPIDYSAGKVPKYYTAILNKGTVDDGIEVPHLAYGSIIPLLFADYDQPGSRGQNLATVKDRQGNNDLMLALFDFGHSFESSDMSKHDVSSDLIMHNGIAGKKESGFHPIRDRWYQRLISQNLLDCSLAERMHVFKHALSVYISEDGKGVEPSLSLKLLFEAFATQLMDPKIDISVSEKKIYLEQLQKSLDSFVARMVHIRDVVLRHRLDKPEILLDFIDQVRLIVSPCTPTSMSKAGYVLKESPINVEIIQGNIVLDGYNKSEVYAAAKKLNYALNYLYGGPQLEQNKFDFITKNGKCYFHMTPIMKAQLAFHHHKEAPFNLFASPYDQALGTNALACAMSRKKELMTIAEHMPVDPSLCGLEDIERLSTLIDTQLADINKGMQAFGLAKNDKLRLQYQFMNTPIELADGSSYSLCDYLGRLEPSLQEHAKQSGSKCAASKLLECYHRFDDALAKTLYTHYQKPIYSDVRDWFNGHQSKQPKTKDTDRENKRSGFFAGHALALIGGRHNSAQQVYV